MKETKIFTKTHRYEAKAKAKKYMFLTYVFLTALTVFSIFNLAEEVPSTDIAETTTAKAISSSFGDYFGISEDETVFPASEDVTYHIETSEMSYTANQVAGYELSEPVHIEANEEYFITLVFSEDKGSFKELEVRRPATGEVERIPFVKPIRSAS